LLSATAAIWIVCQQGDLASMNKFGCLHKGSCFGVSQKLVFNVKQHHSVVCQHIFLLASLLQLRVTAASNPQEFFCGAQQIICLMVITSLF
jgi:hypothetical protein